MIFLCLSFSSCSGCSGPWNEEVEKLPTRERENRNNFRRKAPIWWWKTPFVLSDMLGEVFFLSLQTYYCKHKMKKKCMSTTHLTMHQNFLWRWFKFGWWEGASHHSILNSKVVSSFEYLNIVAFFANWIRINWPIHLVLTSLTKIIEVWMNFAWHHIRSCLSQKLFLCQI